MREVHAGAVLEVAVGPLIGQSGQALHVADERRAEGCRVAGGEAHEEFRVERDMLGSRNSGRTSHLAEQALSSVEAATGEATTDAGHGEQGARLICPCSKEGIGPGRDVVQRIAAQEDCDIILFKQHIWETGRRLITWESDGIEDGSHSLPCSLGGTIVARKVIRIARPSGKMWRRLARSGNVVLEIGQPPGNGDAESSWCLRVNLFHASDSGFELSLRLFESFGSGRNVQLGRNDFMVERRYHYGNSAVAATGAEGLLQDDLHLRKVVRLSQER